MGSNQDGGNTCRAAGSRIQMNDKSIKDRLSGLYVIADSGLLDDHQLLLSSDRALAGGARILQFRDKTSDAAKKKQTAIELWRLCRKYDAVYIINDDPELAVEIDADGVHLGKNDMDIKKARALAGSQLIIGASCYDSIEQARKMKKSGADYLAFGSFYHSRTKPSAPRANIGLLQQARVLDLPLAAIGGVDASNGAKLIGAGADMLAVISAMFYTADTFQAASDLSSLFDRNSAVAG